MVLRTEQIQPFPEGPAYPAYFDEYFKARQVVDRTLEKEGLHLVYSEDDTTLLNPLIFPQTYSSWMKRIEVMVDEDEQVEKKIFPDGDYIPKVYLITTHLAKPSQGLLLVNSQVNLEEAEEALLVSKDLKIAHDRWKSYQLVDVRTTTGGVFAITLPKLGKTISAKGKILSNQPLPSFEYLISPKDVTVHGGIIAEKYTTSSSGSDQFNISLHQISHLSFSDTITEHGQQSISRIWQLHHTNPNADEKQIGAATDQLLALTKNPKKELAEIKERSRQANSVVNSLIPFIERVRS